MYIVDIYTREFCALSLKQSDKDHHTDTSAQRRSLSQRLERRAGREEHRRKDAHCRHL